MYELNQFAVLVPSITGLAGYAMTFFRYKESIIREHNLREAKINEKLTKSIHISVKEAVKNHKMQLDRIDKELVQTGKEVSLASVMQLTEGIGDDLSSSDYFAEYTKECITGHKKIATSSARIRIYGACSTYSIWIFFIFIALNIVFSLVRSNTIRIYIFDASVIIGFLQITLLLTMLSIYNKYSGNNDEL